VAELGVATVGGPADVLAVASQRFARGLLAFPKCEVEFGQFIAYFSKHAIPHLPPEVHAGDMLLACTCSLGLPDALEILERTLRGDVARAVASIDSSSAFVEDTMQDVRERLLVAPGAGPSRIAEYAGRASLKTWLCAISTRVAISARRRQRARPSRSVPELDLSPADGGPELEYLRRRYKVRFEQAIDRAVARLESKQRLLLRLNVLEGMSVDKLASMYRVGRSTAARWLASARAALLEAVRTQLREDLRIGSTELESLAVEICSQLDLSLSAFSLAAPGRS
jgi:RNA polymerase sigma-70 factor (ECF subfamily)